MSFPIEKEQEPIQLLTTAEFVAVLEILPPDRSDLLATFKVDLDPARFIELIGASHVWQILPSSDGQVATVKESSTIENDRSHQSTPFDWHTDGLYYPQVPDIAILYCEKPGTSDISTVFSDTRPIVEKLSQDGYPLDELETTYKGKTGERHSRPFVETHQHTGERILNLGTRVDVGPKFDSTFPLRRISPLLRILFEELDSSQIVHTWQEHDAVVFDNANFVHGRGESNNANGTDSERTLKRIWLSRRETSAA